MQSLLQLFLTAHASLAVPFAVFGQVYKVWLAGKSVCGFVGLFDKSVSLSTSFRSSAEGELMRSVISLAVGMCDIGTHCTPFTPKKKNRFDTLTNVVRCILYTYRPLT